MQALRVFNSRLVSTICGVNMTKVAFDENGISEPLSRADFETFLSIPGFTALAAHERSGAAAELETFLAEEGALPPEGEAPPPAEPTTDDLGQEIPEHDGDETLYERFAAEPNRLDWFAALPLMERLDIASDHRLTEGEAAEMFAWEQCGRKSKRVLSALDRRLLILRQTKSAGAVTNNLLKANFPVQEEQ